MLRRATSQAAAGAKPSPPRAAPALAARDVVINATRLSAQDLARIERKYGLRIADAHYWYDTTSGGWGARGGPTAGFLPPGLALGGPLRADASGGGSGVFVNGREAHAFDVHALSRLVGTPILPTPDGGDTGAVFLPNGGVVSYGN